MTLSSNNLPAEVTTFVGRRHELAEARKKLAKARLVTLVGVGGVGKTRLALRIAANVQRAFPDGVWLVNLAPLHEAELLARTIADALEIRDQSVRPSVDILIEQLKHKRILLVLDNCEHLLAACVEVVDALLRAVPGLRVLATSRQWFGLAGEHVLPVPPLTVPSPVASTAALLRSEAGALLADRVAAEAPGFTITAQNSSAVAQLCQRLDGVPLAIELAAVRLSSLSAEEILDRLDDRFTLLGRSWRSTPPHHATLQATLDWSYDLCSQVERMLWARLSVFSGGFDLDAAETVCSDNSIAAHDIVDILTELVRKSIVVADHSSNRTRYRLLETIRQYGQERLREMGEDKVLRQRHRDYYRRFAAEAANDWFSAREVEWLAKIREEMSNLRSALDFCVTEPGQAEIGLEIALNLTRTRCWFYVCTLGEGRLWLERALSLSPHNSPYRVSALALTSWFALCQGDQESAIALLDKCRKLSDQLGDHPARGALLYIEGVCAFLIHGDSSALGFLTDAREQLTRDGARGDAHLALMFLAFAAAFVGDKELATSVGAECRREAETQGAEWALSWALWALGLTEMRHGDFHRAEKLFSDSLRRQHAIRDQWGPAWGVEALAWAVANTDPERAASLLGAAYSLRQLTGIVLTGLAPFDEAHAECEATVHRLLTAQKYRDAFHRNTTLGFDQAINLAVGTKKHADTQADLTAPGAADSTLTRREREVADLVAQGMSNRDIATKLVVSQRTVGTHVQNIFTKLGFTSRAQVASWSTEQQHRN